MDAAGRALQKSKCGEDRDANGSYRLDDIPDVILQRILSLLPVKDAVRMSLLSKRWQRLWLSIPTLRFEHKDFPEEAVFIKFVERTLLLRDWSSFEKFTLSCPDSDAARVNSWIASVLRRNVQDLHLCFEFDHKDFVLPYCLFRSETLMKLRLAMGGELIVPSSICLPRLKDLTLESAWFVGDGSVQNLLSSAPALENLYMDDCHWVDENDMTILAPNLRTLSIQEDCVDRYCCPGYMVIKGPNVNFFSYSCAFTSGSHDCVLLGSCSLNKATLRFRKPGSSMDLDAFSHLMEGLCMVRSLTLSGGLFQYKCSGDLFEDLPIFCNMTELKLDNERVFLGSERLAIFLKKCPLLRILELAEGFLPAISQALEPVPPCLESQLRKIVVRHFSLTKEIVDCVALLLTKAMVLEEMALYYHEGTTKESYKNSDLKKLPRGSKKCKIALIL